MNSSWAGYLEKVFPPKRMRLSVLLLSLALPAVDFFMGPIIQFPITYMIPVALSAWYLNLRWAVSLALLLPLVRFSFHFLWRTHWMLDEAAVNMVVRMAVLFSFSVLIHRASVQARALEVKVRVLEGFLPICSWCKRIRNEEGQWEQMEVYITERSEAEFTHGICPDCQKKHFPT